MADLIDLRPHINIPSDAFKRQEDPYGSILPNFLQGQQAADLLQKRRAIMQGMQQFGKDPDSLDPVTRMLLPIAQSNPDVAMQLLPTMIAGAYKKQSKGAGTTILYQHPTNGRVSRNPEPGYSPIQVPETVATTRLNTQGTGDLNRKATQGRFDQVMGLNLGKAANKIDLDEASLVDQTEQLEGYLRGLQVEHAQLYPKHGGVVKGRGTRLMSGLMGGTSSYQSPFGEVPVPGSSPEVAAYNNKIDGTIQLLAPFLKEKGKLSDKDAEQRLGQLKASLTKNPATMGKLYGDLIGLLEAIKTNDVNRVNRAYARLGIKTRLKPNPQNAQIEMQKAMLASMITGQGQMNPQTMNPQDLQGMSDEQLMQLNSQVEE